MQTKSITSVQTAQKRGDVVVMTPDRQSGDSSSILVTRYSFFINLNQYLTFSSLIYRQYEFNLKFALVFNYISTTDG